MYGQLPNTDLIENGELYKQFLKLCITTFHETCDSVWKLPYGRNNNKADWRLDLEGLKNMWRVRERCISAISSKKDIR